MSADVSRHIFGVPISVFHKFCVQALDEGICLLRDIFVGVHHESMTFQITHVFIPRPRPLSHSHSPRLHSSSSFLLLVPWPAK